MSLWLRPLRSMALTTTWSLASTVGSAEAAKTFEVLSGAFSSSCWGPEQSAVVARTYGVHTLNHRAICSACVVAGVSCKHTRCGGGQSKQEELEPTAGPLAAVGALSVHVH